MKKKISIGIFIILAVGIFVIISRNKKALNIDGTYTQTSNLEHEIQNGDIIFQTSTSSQSKAIQLATKSPYSHCGIIYNTNGKLYVFEAVQPVKSTPLEKWIARGKNGHYVIKRLKNANEILTPEVLTLMKKEGRKFQGKSYDLAFDWSDDKMYCSELIWKIYKRAANIEIGQLERLGSFELSDPLVAKKVKERYGEKIPLDQWVISPSNLLNSEKLYTVKKN